MEILELFAPYGPGWLVGVLLALMGFYFGQKLLEEYKAQNERKSELDTRREERSATASARRWRAASPPRWRGPTLSWRP